MSFPLHRPRRLRTSGSLRQIVRETHLCTDDLIWPLFVMNGTGISDDVASMPGVFRYSVDMALEACREADRFGIRAVILFGLPDHKDDVASYSADEQGPVAQLIRKLKAELPKMVVMTDVCLCAYTDHGHCGIVRDGVICNDETLPLLAKMAVCHARAGADVVAPSDMMDGRVAAIRAALDKDGFENTSILSYSVKYSSAYYGPFRDAAGSAPSFGDRKTHQMDPGNLREAIREAALDIEEGADMVMVKPALSYLDVIHAVKESVNVPMVAYNVSGEYAMLKAAAANGWIDGEAVMMETLLSMKRAGADLIITYHALEAATCLRKDI